MAVPKRKVSKARRNSRRATWTAAAPTLVECPHCKEKIKAHTVCGACGYYNGKEVVAVKNKEKEEK